ncbi:hypothetical protein BKA82DRAFT_547781 [Pisolithus tinctorius]|uniref:Uncharacterized protein n=1 Tax=Pisolithus tinctorius Marx 270 TaxID=870435 RepID=A0A0C3PA53_PISTI|nr:hypothetical protein BKA82DRAFT_547781 [Pisolithus tinctorius]KIO04444.1 hypothetical protein M404DRAFT_547781 [Pisolithus tinctorius Marx 270]
MSAQLRSPALRWRHLPSGLPSEIPWRSAYDRFHNKWCSCYHQKRQKRDTRLSSHQFLRPISSLPVWTIYACFLAHHHLRLLDSFVL